MGTLTQTHYWTGRALALSSRGQISRFPVCRIRDNWPICSEMALLFTDLTTGT